MEVLTVEFRIKEEFIIAFAAAIVENARASRDTEPGCHQFDVCRDATDPQLFFLYELYEDEAAIQAHLQTAHFLRMNQTTAAWVESKTVWRGSRLAPA